jgi:hypothetical protein
MCACVCVREREFHSYLHTGHLRLPPAATSARAQARADRPSMCGRAALGAMPACCQRQYWVGTLGNPHASPRHPHSSCPRCALRRMGTVALGVSKFCDGAQHKRPTRERFRPSSFDTLVAVLQVRLLVGCTVVPCTQRWYFSRRPGRGKVASRRALKTHRPPHGARPGFASLQHWLVFLGMRWRAGRPTRALCAQLGSGGGIMQGNVPCYGVISCKGTCRVMG